MVFVTHFLIFVMAFLISFVVTSLYIGFIHLDDKLIQKYKGPDYVGFISKRIGIFFISFFIIMLIIFEIMFLV